MIPEQKAVELVEKFKKYADKKARPSSLGNLGSIGGRGGITYNTKDILESSKQCGIIAVDEILDSYDKNKEVGNGLIPVYNFWEQVKEQIQKL